MKSFEALVDEYCAAKTADERSRIMALGEHKFIGAGFRKAAECAFEKYQFAEQQRLMVELHRERA